MDAIPRLGAAAEIAQGAARPSAPSDGFSVPDGRDAPAGVAAAPVSMAGLLALQEAGGEDVRDRDAKRRGRDLLDELAALQRDLLAGGPDAARLTRLADLARDVPEASDPRLRNVMQAIVLRARVESARYGPA